MPLHFEHPEMLWLLFLLPAVWFLSRSQFRMLGTSRAIAANLARSLVLLLVICTLAGVEYVSRADRVAVMFLLDQSESIDPRVRQRMIDYVEEVTEEYREQGREDLAGVIAFGRNAAVAVPAISEPLPRRAGLESVRFDTTATNLEQAIRLAKVSFPAGAKRRIVIISDGNETTGTALRASRDASNEGIGVDVVPIDPPPEPDVVVEKVDLPRFARIGDPFEARVIVNWEDDSAANSDGTSTNNTSTLRGNLMLTRTSRGTRQLIEQRAVEVRPGTNIFTFQQQLEDPASFVYEATFTPAQAGAERFAENNRAAGFLVISGQRRALLITQPETLETWQWLAEACREESILVDIEPVNSTFSNLAELQDYDIVILADVPRYRFGDTSSPPTISDSQLTALVTHAEELGAGLLMLGGPEAFGAGGWDDTSLEEAMPVDFNIDSLQREARAAIMMVLDSSGSMDGQKIELCKRAAREAILAMSPTDFIGVLSFDSTTHEIVPMQTAGNRNNIARLIQRIRVGGGTDLYQGMRRAYEGLRGIEAVNKHMLILTDGQTDNAGIRSLAEQCLEEGIKITSLAVGQDADRTLMRDLARLGQGRYFSVDAPEQIPRILLRETKRISLPLVYESEQPIQLIIESSHPVIRGRAGLPPVRGYVLTQLKQNPLAQTVVSATRPLGRQYPLIATWQYGLGRAAVLTTDGGQRWAQSWTASPEQIEIYTRLIRWAMRPLSNSQNVQLTSRFVDGQIEVAATITDDQRNYRNLANVKGAMIGPDGSNQVVELEQIAPGRYATAIPAEREGVYLMSVLAEPGASPITTGVSVPFGLEYRASQTNLTLLRELAGLMTTEGISGQLSEPLSLGSLPSDLNPFRDELPPDATFQNIRPWTLFATCLLFLCDVFIRRVTQNLDWIDRFRRRRKETAEPSPTHLSSLEQAKRQARQQVAAKRFQLNTPETAEPSTMTKGTSEPAEAFAQRPAPSDQATRAPASLPSSTAGSEASTAKPAEKPSGSEPSYTDRLLAAKRRARDRRSDS